MSRGILSSSFPRTYDFRRRSCPQEIVIYVWHWCAYLAQDQCASKWMIPRSQNEMLSYVVCISCISCISATLYGVECRKRDMTEN